MTIANRSKGTIGSRSQRAINKAAKKQLHKNQRAVSRECTRSACEYAGMMLNALVDHSPVIVPVPHVVGYTYVEQVTGGFVWPVEHTFITRDTSALSHIIPVTYKGNRWVGRKPRTELLVNAHRVTIGISSEVA